jgi:hypothetical protein
VGRIIVRPNWDQGTTGTVAGAWHVCGGNLGENPFGFSRSNCPYPDSLMANLGDLPTTPSPQDRLASCIMNHPGTQPGNTFPDTNVIYIYQ